MSVLESFYMLFAQEGLDDVAKEVDKTDKTLNTLEKSVGNVADEQDNLAKQNEKTANSFDKVANSILKTIAPIVGLAMLKSKVLNFANEAESLSYMADSAGMAIDKFQALTNAVKNYGGSAESLSSTLSSLSSNLQNLKFGGGGPLHDMAMKYGLDFNGSNGLATAEEMLINIAKRFEDLDQASQVDLGKGLGLDDATIRLLQTGVENVNKELARGKKFSLFTKEDVERAKQFQRVLREFQGNLDKIWAIMSRALLPVLTWLTDKFSSLFEFISENEAFVLGFFGSLLAIMGVLAIKSAIAFAPILLFIAAIVAISALIGLVVDDIVGWINGVDSLFGRLFGKFEDFKAYLTSIKDYILDLWNTVTGFFDKLGKGIKTKLGLGDENESMIKNAKSALNQTMTPLSSVTSGGISNTSRFNNNENNINISEIKIETQATDAEGISTSLKDTIVDELKFAMTKIDDGVLA